MAVRAVFKVMVKASQQRGCKWDPQKSLLACTCQILECKDFAEDPGRPDGFAYPVYRFHALDLRRGGRQVHRFFATRGRGGRGEPVSARRRRPPKLRRAS